MPIQLGAPPQHAFDEPLGLLSDCHRRIESFLSVQRRIVQQTVDGPLNDEQRTAVETALTYFRTAAPRHNQDEEQSLFPLLRQSAQPATQAALKVMESLQDDHTTAAPAHQRIDELFQHWIDTAALHPRERQDLLRLLDDLTQMYQQHIGVEDTILFPLAAEVLTHDQLKHLGTEMAQRRGLSISTPIQTTGNSAMNITSTIDVRDIPKPQRHPLIFDTFDKLPPGEALELVNDHDPFPLRSQFNMMKRGQFSWDYLQQGPDLWRVRIGRLDPPQAKV